MITPLKEELIYSCEKEGQLVLRVVKGKELKHTLKRGAEFLLNAEPFSGDAMYITVFAGDKIYIFADGEGSEYEIEHDNVVI